jgi:hypothetical protein
MELESLKREVRILKTLVVGMLAACAVVLIAATEGAWSRENFDQITVHRINVVDDNGMLRLAISNKDNMPPPMMRGKPFAVGMRSVSGQPSLIFYNAQGDEQGGFRWGGSGSYPGTYQQFMSMSFDQFQQNDDMILDFEDSNSGRDGGLLVQEQPDDTPVDQELNNMIAAESQGKTEAERTAIQRQFLAAHFRSRERFFAGLKPSGSVVRLSDKNGRVRLLMTVDDEGNPKLQFFDAAGHVTYQLPPATP